LGIQDLGFEDTGCTMRVYGLRFEVNGPGFRSWGFGVWSLGIRGLRFRAQGSRFRVYGLGFRV